MTAEQSAGTVHLPRSVAAWGSPDFAPTVKEELRVQRAGLPLQQGLRGSSYVTDDSFEVLVRSSSEGQDAIALSVGIFFSGVVAGCNCADDPTPVEANTEYCELRLRIDRGSGETQVWLVG